MSATHRFCARCGATLAEAALSCPVCHALVYAADLEQVATEARTAQSAAKLGDAAESWKKALALLPPESQQYKTVAAQVEALESAVRAPQAEKEHKERHKWGKLIAQVGIAGALLWKFKWVMVLGFGKLKLLITGLTKFSTVASMLVSLGVYWNWFGWKFALGFILSIYVHEMGHVAALKRYGIPASAPMFIPGFGAIVRLKAHPPTVGQDARVGLAGPVWGLAAALVSLAAGLVTENKLWLAIAHSGAQINLFNMIPIWQLDGGRGFAALTAKQRIQMLIFAAMLWTFTSVSLFFLILLAGGYKLWVKDHAKEPDRGAFWQFAALLLALGVLSSMPVTR